MILYFQWVTVLDSSTHAIYVIKIFEYRNSTFHPKGFPKHFKTGRRLQRIQNALMDKMRFGKKKNSTLLCARVARVFWIRENFECIYRWKCCKEGTEERGRENNFWKIGFNLTYIIPYSMRNWAESVRISELYVFFNHNNISTPYAALLIYG